MVNEGFNSYQEAFDAVALHMKTQGKRAYDREGCTYLNNEGLKCNIGAFIPDGHLSQRSTCSFDYLISDYPDLKSIFSIAKRFNKKVEYFWRECQKLHDTADDYFVPTILHEIKQYGVDTSVMDTFAFDRS